MSLLLGCVADDFTGATDLANTLVRSGMRVVQTIGLPEGPIDDADAVVVALKSRTAPVRAAIADSLAAAAWLRRRGAAQIYFKVCSTFDSTAEGNIGPVAEALREQLGADIVIVTPAFPANGRTVFKGHLFVGDQLLSDSPMRHHPLTPMRDANLVRVLQAQLAKGRAGLLDHAVLSGGATAVSQRLAQLRALGCQFAVADAVSDDDLRILGAAARAHPLLVGGSGLAIGLAALHGLAPSTDAARLPAAQGARAVVSGSCSAMTNTQVAAFLSAGGEGFAVDPLRIAAGEDVAAAALGWAAPRLGGRPLLVYATAEPAAVRAVQARLGTESAGALVEDALARVAVGLVDAGVGQLIIAGGETAGACVNALGIRQLRIGPQIDPGVPWCHARDLRTHLALKSGNFGGTDFFTRAFDVLSPT